MTGIQYMLNEWMIIANIYLSLIMRQGNIGSDFSLLNFTNTEFVLFPMSKKTFLEVIFGYLISLEKL